VARHSEILPVVRVGCDTSEFDQNGVTEAFGAPPGWNRQLSKFAFGQDRLLEWKPDVHAKIKGFPCLTILSLSVSTRPLRPRSTPWLVGRLIFMRAKALGKNNCLIVGEATGDDTSGSLYL
jgi:alpha-1,3-glucan synthase